MPSISFCTTVGKEARKKPSGLAGKPACVLAPPTLGGGQGGLSWGGGRFAMNFRKDGRESRSFAV